MIDGLAMRWILSFVTYALDEEMGSNYRSGGR